jgi:hypothetical protein
MKTQESLIAALLAAFPNHSQAEIARKAGLSPARFNNYAQGLRSMDDDAVIGCAQALSWDARDTVSHHRADLAKTDRERHFWRRLGTAAALAVLGLTLSGAMSGPLRTGDFASNAYYVFLTGGALCLFWALCAAHWPAHKEPAQWMPT